MNDEKAGIFQMIMQMLMGGKKPQQQQPPPPPQPQTQFAPTAMTIAAPTRREYLEYATTTDNPLPMNLWIQQEQARRSGKQ